MKRVKPGNYFFILTVCLFFFFFLLLAHPAYNSDDDIYFLYTISGAYGIPPSILLHYSLGWNPVLSWPVMKLFQLLPQVNWYTIFLLALHWVSCLYLLRLLETLFSWKRALAVFFIFFLFIEARLLLSLNYSGTSLVLSTIGVSAFLIYYKEANTYTLFPRSLVAAALLLVAGGCLRLHVVAICTLLAMTSGLFLMPFSHYKAMTRALLLPGLALLLLTAGQEVFYRRAIPNWEEEESFRQSVFNLYNHPLNPGTAADSNHLITYSFIKNSFLYDTAFVSHKEVNSFARKTIQRKPRLGPKTLEGIYWAFIESRVYLLLWITLFVGFFLAGKVNMTRKWLWQCLPPFLLFCYLYAFLKITESIFLALISALFFSAVFTGRELQINSRSKKWTFYLLLFFSCAWMAKRLVSMDTRNRHSIEVSRFAMGQLKEHKDWLFISSDNQFPLNISVWDTPQNYPLENFLNKELALTNTHKAVLQRRGITSLAPVLPFRRDIVLVGTGLPLLNEYYKYREQREVEIKKIAQWGKMGVYRVSAQKRP